MKKFKRWVVDLFWHPDMTESIVSMWFRENEFEVIADRVKQEMVICHLSYNPGQKPKEGGDEP